MTFRVAAGPGAVAVRTEHEHIFSSSDGYSKSFLLQ